MSDAGYVFGVANGKSVRAPRFARRIARRLAALAYVTPRAGSPHTPIRPVFIVYPSLEQRRANPNAMALLATIALLGAPPASYFNLSNFKLQLPVSNGNGGVEEISQPALNSYNSTYFYSLPGEASAYFFTPTDGATTGGSSFPRSELREQFDWVLGSAGRHALNATIRVLDDGPLHAVTIGQIHGDGLSGACSIIIELEWQAGDIVSHVRNQACKNVNQVVATGYKLGEPVDLALVSDGVTVSASADRGMTQTQAYPWLAGKGYKVYFKVGNYLQANTGKGGSVTALDKLLVEHAGA